MANNNYETIYSWNLSANSALSLSLMHDPESKYNKYFVFLNVAPGEKSENGGRTYNYKASTSFKIQLHILGELGYALGAYARGQSEHFGPYSIMVDSSRSNYSNGSGEKKSIFLKYSNEPEKAPFVALIAKTASQQKGISVMMSTATAMVVADVCKKIFDLYMDYDIKNYVPYNKSTNNQSQSRGSSYQSSSNSIKSAPVQETGGGLVVDENPW